jgi:hypothetical protein
MHAFAAERERDREPDDVSSLVAHIVPLFEPISQCLGDRNESAPWHESAFPRR